MPIIEDIPTVPLSLYDALKYVKFAFASGTGLGTIKDAVADDDDAGWQQIATSAAKPTLTRAEIYQFSADDIKNAVRIANSWILSTGGTDGFMFAKVDTQRQQVLPVLAVRSDAQLASGKYQALLAGSTEALAQAADDPKTCAVFGDDRVWSLSVDVHDRLAVGKGGVPQLVFTPDGRVWSAGIGGYLRVVPATFAMPETQLPQLRTMWPPESAQADYHGWQITVSYIGYLVFSHRDQPRAVLFSDGDLWLANGAGFAAPSPTSSPSVPLGIGKMLAVVAGAGVYLGSQGEAGYNLARDGVMTAVNWIAGAGDAASNWSKGAESAVADWGAAAASDTAAWFKGSAGTVEAGFDVAVSWSGTALNDAAGWLENAGKTIGNTLDPTKW